MSNVNVEESFEIVETDMNDLIIEILKLEDNEMLDEHSTDECIYHLRKLSAILGVDVDLDFFNDEYIAEREGIDLDIGSQTG